MVYKPPLQRKTEDHALKKTRTKWGKKHAVKEKDYHSAGYRFESQLHVFLSTIMIEMKLMMCRKGSKQG